MPAAGRDDGPPGIIGVAFTIAAARALRDGKWGPGNNDLINVQAWWDLWSDPAGPINMTTQLLDKNGQAWPITGGDLKFSAGAIWYMSSGRHDGPQITLSLHGCTNQPDSAYYSVSVEP